jgi:hypothetical protein
MIRMHLDNSFDIVRICNFLDVWLGPTLSGSGFELRLFAKEKLPTGIAGYKSGDGTGGVQFFHRVWTNWFRG